ncbi:MAG: SelB C-terminal domain-containing protein, partial [Clostridia bacterium]|nr:SelB C-terminal domain-containing protein [Clostridia bacterium]
ISLAEVRDILGTSRKYALPFLEYLDQTKVTRRVGDKRVLAGGSRN